MANFAPVLPAALLPILDVKNDYHYHFAHAPQVRTSPWLLKWLQHSDKCTIILDCFAYELDGDKPNVDELYWAADELEANWHTLVVIVPDVLRNPDETSRLAIANLEPLSKYGMPMLVPHAHDLASWFEHAEYLIDIARNGGQRDKFMLGLPRYMHDWTTAHGEPARSMAARWLRNYYPKVGLHLLGAATGLPEAVCAASSPNVVSVDSTGPFTCGLEIGFMDSPYIPYKFEMQSGWWDLSIEDLTKVQIEGVRYNIALWKDELYYVNPYFRL